MNIFKFVFARPQKAGTTCATALSATALTGLLLAGAPATASVTYDSSGFESPRFVAAQSLTGQDPAPPPLGFGGWKQDRGTSTAAVQTDIPNGGLQSVKVTKVAGATGDTRWGINVPITPTAANNVVAIDFDMNATIS